VVEFERRGGGDFIVGVDDAADFLTELQNIGAIEVSDELYEILRIESGIPKYGKDMDESTIVPELAIDGLISYNKGCYIGQEIIARIHFRGHVAKQMSGLVFIGDDQPAFGPDGELKTTDGKNAGRITSHTFSPKLGKNIALAYVRYENLAPGTILLFDGHEVKVYALPFI
jgi:folate-binding protein YgfZ